jgi:hypothetical protein
MPNRRFYLQSGSGSDGLHLHIEDDVSGVTLADIQLTAEQTWSLLRGGTMHVDGKQTDHLERVGKQMVNESLSVPGSLIRDVEYGDRVKVGEQWARETAPGWDTYEARRTNTGGVSVIVRKWIG